MRSKIHWLSIILAYSSLFLLGLADNIRGPLFPEVLSDLQLSDAKGSLLWATASFCGLLGSLGTNALIRRFGVLSSLQVALALIAMGQFGMSFSQSFAWALVSGLVFGFSLGILGVSQNLLVLQAGPAEIMPKLQAGLHSNYALSSLLAPLFLTFVYWLQPGWRAGYMGGGLLTLVGFVALCFVSRHELDRVHPPGGHTAGHGTKSHSARNQIERTLQFRLQALYVGLIFALYVLTEVMVSSRLALFVRRESGLNFTQASLATTSFFVLLFAGRLLLVFWKPKASVKTQMMLSLVSSLGLILIGLYIEPLAVVLSGLSMAPFFPLAMAYLGEKFPGHLNASLAWAMSLNGFFVVSMHVLVGIFSDSLGITRALMIGPLALLVSSLLLFFDGRVFARK